MRSARLAFGGATRTMVRRTLGAAAGTGGAATGLDSCDSEALIGDSAVACGCGGATNNGSAAAGMATGGAMVALADAVAGVGPLAANAANGCPAAGVYERARQKKPAVATSSATSEPMANGDCQSRR